MVAFVLLRVFLILLLVAANAFFAAAEFALVSVRETRIQQLIEAHRIGARTVLKLHQQPGRVVNGVQLGITVISLTLGWLGEPVLAHLVESCISCSGSACDDLCPRHRRRDGVHPDHLPARDPGRTGSESLALQRAEQVALAVAAPMDVFLTVTRPVLFVMSRSGWHGAAAVRTREMPRRPVHSPDELKLIVTASRQFGQLPASRRR